MRSVKYPDIGLPDTLSYWNDQVLPAYQRFTKTPNRANALVVAEVVWNLHDHMWHDINPGIDTRGAQSRYETFRQDLFIACPDLEDIQDVAETLKHSGLGRKGVRLDKIEGAGGSGGKVQEFSPLGMDEYVLRGQLDLKREDKSTGDLNEILDRAINFWHAKLVNQDMPITVWQADFSPRTTVRLTNGPGTRGCMQIRFGTEVDAEKAIELLKTALEKATRVDWIRDSEAP